MTNIRNSSFDSDPYPGKLKILFIGLPESSHTHSWIRLLDGCEFNIRLFSTSEGIPPPDWKIPTYLTTHFPPHEMDLNRYRSFYPPVEVMDAYQEQLTEYNQHLNHYQKSKIFSEQIQIYKDRCEKYLRPGFRWFFMRLFRFGMNQLARFWGFPRVEFKYSEWQPKNGVGKDFIPPKQPVMLPPPERPSPAAESAEAWLAKVILDWKPDIIHTLGLFDGQGGEFYHRARKAYHLEGCGKWVLQLRGGSDLRFRHLHPEWKPRVAAILRECDQIISDNYVNITYAAEFGVFPEKFASITPVPGTGGISVEEIRRRFSTRPSHRDRILLLPKSYESIWSKTSPVIEALRLAWDSIKPCKLIFTATSEETKNWIYTLPKDLQESCIILDRVNREDFMNYLGQARVVLAPSLVDGVPNTLYEAMACGTFPIVSPLDTIRPVVQAGDNVLYARNLYPGEIAEAITKAMNDDDLVDQAFSRNYDLVMRLVNRAKVKEKVIDYYNSLGTPGLHN